MTAGHDDEPIGLYWGVAWLMVGFGACLMLEPDNYFGPSWHFFPQLPPNGFWMGLCCTMLGMWQLVVLWRNRLKHILSRRLLALLFFLGSVVLWTSGTTLIAAGLLGHQGLQEGPAYLIIAGHKVFVSAQLARRDKYEKRLDDGR
jgi:hypothetical protein